MAHVVAKGCTMNKLKNLSDAAKRPRNYWSYVKLGLVAVCLIGLIITLKSLLTNPALIQSFLDGAKNHPGRTVPVFILLNLAAPLFFLPSAPFQLLAGAVWGIFLGFAISGTSSLAANLIAFSVGRYFFRDKLSTYITANVPSFPAIQGAIVAEGWKLLLMLRLSPVLPDSLMNYAMALTPVTFDMFASATAVAMVPWVLLYIYLGSASKDIIVTMTGSGGGSSDGDSSDDSSSTSAANSSTSWFNILLTAGSVLLGVFAVVYLGRVIKVAIAKAEAAERRRAEAGSCGLDSSRGEEIEGYCGGVYSSAGEEGGGVQLSHSERVPLLGGLGSVGSNSSVTLNNSSLLSPPASTVKMMGAAGRDVLSSGMGSYEEEEALQVEAPTSSVGGVKTGGRARSP
ncbi:hypothetical protein CEUSTIGMA_g7725.t1 [Chlamydomonas eustigma]|uniref:VTT domain-containing protein n=1 Tax=Chlamydomonas eustigma TaxID=1157962 RepID=A0A250XB29_9CHLO|nr:hypothetical protein CEUSTIGMA_g7725.t1 [Chlamydomonas eustigma]|eukprot:GAX80287.1 hypothetical protein CEUSTIGMA_g7725.t1 [Chlamydomonas eustigma]